MKGWKEEWREKMNKIKKEKVKWIWQNNWRDKYEGEYEGKVKEGKPNGFGRWTRNGHNSTVEAE